MKTKFGFGLLFVVMLVLLIFFVVVFNPPTALRAQESSEQTRLAQKYIDGGVQAKGAGILQDGQLSTLSASIASATAARLATAPASGSIYLRAILVEKAATAASGSTITLTTGTGTNCGTGTATLLGPIAAPPAGLIPLGVQITAGKDLCGATDAATTVARLLTN